MAEEKPSTEKPHTPEKPAKTAPQDEKGGFRDKNLPEPTRFGDWEVGGRCSDF